MNKKHQLDLTNGPIMKTLAELALPIMASSFLGTAYNITDMAWIGVLGSKAVAGVGMGGIPYRLPLSRSEAFRDVRRESSCRPFRRGRRSSSGFLRLQAYPAMRGSNQDDDLQREQYEPVRELSKAALLRRISRSYKRACAHSSRVKFCE